MAPVKDCFIDLRFVEGGSLVSRAIRRFTRSKWSHVEVMLGTTVTFGAQLWGGVRRRSTFDGCYRKARSYKILRIPCTGAQKSSFFSFLLAQSGKPYDRRNIAAFAFFARRDWREDDSWFCSELDARGFEVSTILKLPPDSSVSKISPGMLYLLMYPLAA
jgi:uncharacterized protein YycO